MPTPTDAADRSTVGSISILTDDEVTAAVDQHAAIASIREVLLSAHRGTAHGITKTMTQWGESSTAHSLGAVDMQQRVVAFKNWVNTPRGASALLSLFDSTEGRPLAVMSAGALGMLRTAGTAAAATDILAIPDAAVMAVLGTGRQALQQVHAVLGVRRLELVRVWSPSVRSREAFARQVTDVFGMAVEVADNAEQAVRGASIITTVTRSNEPFVDGAWLEDGAHLNAIGAILPTAAELLPTVLPLSGLTVVDDLENARRASRELREYFGADLTGVMTLGEAIDRGVTRPPDTRLTVFKGVGSGLTDLAIACLVWRTVEASHTEGLS